MTALERELLVATANAVLALYGDPYPSAGTEVSAVTERLNELAAAMRDKKEFAAAMRDLTRVPNHRIQSVRADGEGEPLEQELEQEPSEQEKQGG